MDMREHESTSMGTVLLLRCILRMILPSEMIVNSAVSRGRPIYLLKANRYRYRYIGIGILDIGIGIIGIGIGIGYEK